MLLAKIGRSKVAILLSQADKMERPSDIDGLIYIPFSNNVEEGKCIPCKRIKSEMDIQSISKISDSDYHMPWRNHHAFIYRRYL